MQVLGHSLQAPHHDIVVTLFKRSWSRKVSDLEFSLAEDSLEGLSASDPLALFWLDFVLALSDVVDEINMVIVNGPTFDPAPGLF